MKLLKFAALAAAGTLSAAAFASPVTAGHTTRQAGSQIIEDSLNQRQWLGADVTRNMTYDQTLQAIGAGGQFEGYQMARTTDALMFVHALAGGASNCTDYGYQDQYVNVHCGNVGASVGTVFGESYYDYATSYYSYYGYYGYDYDYVATLSDSGNYGADLIQLYDESGTSQLSVFNWAQTSDVDYYASANLFGFLLYRDGNAVQVNAIPEPGTLALAGLAVMGVAATRRRRGR